MPIEFPNTQDDRGPQCIVLANVAKIIGGSTSVIDRRSGFEAGLRKVRAAVCEALETGISQVEIELTLGASPIDTFLAQHESIGAETARAIHRELHALIVQSGDAAHRIHYSNAGTPTSIGAALAGACRKASHRPLAVLVPHEMLGVGAACLRELVIEYDRLVDVATVVAATVGMDDLPRISWLACRGQKIFARHFEDASAAPSDLSELRLIGRCILPPSAKRLIARKKGAQAIPATLSDLLNHELESGRKVIARKFSRRGDRAVDAGEWRSNIAAMREIPELRAAPVCAIPV